MALRLAMSAWVTFITYAIDGDFPPQAVETMSRSAELPPSGARELWTFGDHAEDSCDRNSVPSRKDIFLSQSSDTSTSYLNVAFQQFAELELAAYRGGGSLSD
jgi:hypothetical protein